MMSQIASCGGFDVLSSKFIWINSTQAEAFDHVPQCAVSRVYSRQAFRHDPEETFRTSAAFFRRASIAES